MPRSYNPSVSVRLTSVIARSDGREDGTGGQLGDKPLSSVARRPVLDRSLRCSRSLDGQARESQPDRHGRAVQPPLKRTGFGLVRDLHDCWLLANETHMSLVVLDQAAKGLRDKEMQELVERVDHQNKRQRSWLLTRIKQAAPQALVVPS